MSFRALATVAAIVAIADERPTNAEWANDAFAVAVIFAIGFNGIAGRNAPIHFNDFGGNIGGPVIKNRVFFFFAVEQIINHSTPAVSFQTVPTAAMRAGASITELNGLGHWWMLQDPARGAAAISEFWSSLS